MKALPRSLKAALRELLSTVDLVWNKDSEGVLWAPALSPMAGNVFITSLSKGMKGVSIMFPRKTKRGWKHFGGKD